MHDTVCPKTVGGSDMDKFSRGTMIAAVGLSGIFVVGIPAALESELGLTRTLVVLALALSAIWGTSRFPTTVRADSLYGPRA